MSTQTENTAVAKKGIKPIDSVRAALEKMQPQFAMALPKHITPERMCRIALTAIQNTPKLLDCDRQSLYSAIMRAAQLGLEPDGILGQAYLVPYGTTVQFIPGYKGLIDLARRSGEVSNIIAKEVYENDEFTVDWSQETPFHHKPKLDGVRGAIKFFWALARFKDGGFHWDYMSYDEVIAIRNRSSGWKYAVSKSKEKSSPWHSDFAEMGKKTAIRRIAKYLPMSVQRASMTEDLMDAGKKFTTSDMGDIIVEQGEVIDNQAADASADKKISKLDAFVTPHDPITGEIKSPPLATTEDRAAAGNQLVLVLEAVEPEDRPSVFLQAFGNEIVEALKAGNQLGLIDKIKNLGIKLEEAP